MTRLFLAAALTLLAAPAFSQFGGPSTGTALPGFQSQPAPAPNPFTPPAVSTSPAPIPAAYQATLGNPLPIDHGPWVLGEVLFFSSGRAVNDTTWRDRVRGSRGALYTQADIMSDVDSLMALGKFDKIEPSVFDIQGQPVPPDFATIAVSTDEVRLVFNVTEKASVSGSSTTVKRPLPPASISGVILTPTAYRGAGRYTTPGLGLDINAVYIIGRLYGKNNFPNAPAHTNYLDRVGVWLMQADGKMQVQSETSLRPAAAAGFQGTFMFRDSPQPDINDPNPTVNVNASQKTTQLLGDGYFVFSKKIGPARTSVGMMVGNEGDAIGQFSEFLTPDALRFFANKPGEIFVTRNQPFGSIMLLPKPQYPLAVEFIKLNGAPLNPWLMDFKVGYFLHLNFDLGLLKFQGGYDLLGLLQFRFNQFPRY